MHSYQANVGAKLCHDESGSATIARVTIDATLHQTKQQPTKQGRDEHD